MVNQIVVLTAPSGFHARPASQFVKMANGFKSEVSLGYGDTVVNGKSIMGILTLGAGQGSEVVLTVSGDDEAEALETLANFMAIME